MLNFMPEISIITVNYKTYKDVLELSNSIMENPYPNLNLVVVDNSEEEEEFKALEAGLKTIFTDSDKKFFLIKNCNNGYAGGNNIGIKFAIQSLNSEYIWLLNPDTIIAKHTPLELLKTVKFTNIPVVTCKILDYYTNNCQYDGKRVYLDGGIEDVHQNEISIVSFLSGANIFIRSDVISKVGYIEEKFFLYFEDNEFFLRLVKNGIYPIYTPFTHIYHKGSVSTGGFLKNPVSIYYYTRNILHWTKQNADKESLADALMSVFNTHIYNIYNANVHKKHNLIALIKGVIDYFDGVYGKFDILNFVNQKFEKKKFQQIELFFPHRLKDAEMYLYGNPRDYESFKKFFDLRVKLNTFS